jgi:photosystem II stability/assembly factor-like uncharacterized protein
MAFVIAAAFIPEGMAQAQVQRSGPELALPVWSYAWTDSTAQTNFRCLAMKGTKMFAGTDDRYLQVTTDMGKTWSEKGPKNGLDIPFGRIDALLVLPSGGLLLCADNGVYKSDNDGENFRRVCADGGYALLRTRNGVIFSGKGGGGMYKSTNDGETWIVSADSVLSPTVYPTGFVETRGGVLLATTQSYKVADGVIRSIDGGKTWIRSNKGLSETNLVSIASDSKSSPEKIFASGYSNGVFVTEDGGQSWLPVAELTEKRGGSVFSTSQAFYFGFLADKREPLYQFVSGAYGSSNFPLGFMVLSGCQCDDRHVGIGTHNGFLLGTYPQITKVEDPAVPSSFSLSQNFPNPFNPSTTIRFSLLTRTNVNLKVYNTIGQVVETLVSSEMESGIHQVIWNAGQYPSGMYFYQIETSTGFKEAKKMLLVK